MNDLDRIKTTIRPILDKYQIKKAGIFGSAGRTGATPNGGNPTGFNPLSLNSISR
ncbi:MAG: hypothetical protein WEA36_00700 [Balneolaceae bacterium]